MFKKMLLTCLLLATLVNISIVPQSHATVSSTTNQVIYNGDGVTSIFPFSFNVFNTASENDLVVSKQNTTTGAITTLALTTDYTISLTHAIPSPGSITLVAGALASGFKLSILRTLPLTQNVRIADNAATPAATTNAVYDRLVMSDQQLQQQITRAILQNPFSTTQISLPAGVAGLVLCWDPTATSITNCTATGVQTIPVPIPNSYLSTINTAGVVDGAAIIGLANLPSGAGLIPVANLPTGTSANKLVLLNGSSQIPAVSGALLTNLPTPTTLNLSYVKDTNTQLSGTDGGTATSGSWANVILTQEDNDTGNISTLSSNQVTLPAGTYQVRAIQQLYATNRSQIRLRNITDTSTILLGVSTSNYAAGPSDSTNVLAGQFTLAGTKTIALQYFVQTTAATSGLGRDASSGENNVFAILEFWKIS